MAASSLSGQQTGNSLPLPSGGGIAVAADNQQLLQEAVAGNQTALERLLLIECAAVHQHIARQLPNWVRDSVSVEDVLQETLTQAFRDIGQFDFRSERSLRNWLYTIADHRLQDLMKGLRRKKRGGGWAKLQIPVDAGCSSRNELVELVTGHDDSPSQAAARGEIVEAIHVGLATLPEDEREAVRRCCVEFQDYAAAGQAMGRSPHAVRSLVYRAKHSLRSFMGRSSRWFFK
jgi:RNA polymerase sigma-70 factor (ECF subfamily)